MSTMQQANTSPSPLWLAMLVGIGAWAASLLMLALALKFRLMPGHGDESDIAVGILIVLSAPLICCASVFAFPRRVSVVWRIALIAPALLALAALIISTVGVSGRS